MFVHAVPTRARATAVAAFLAALLVAILVAPVPAHAGSHRPRREPGPLVPRKGALFGTTVGPAEFHPNLQELEGAIGRKFDIVQHYHGWTEEFPYDIERQDVEAGRIPMIGWVSAPLDQILSGDDDQMIRDRAEGLKSLGAKVFLRWGYEMNGTWFPWAGPTNGGAAGADKYVRAWRHIHDIFTDAGANNVIWVWAPNWEDRPDKGWNHWTNYYPGDDYVDWVGIDGFNWGTTQDWSKWVSIAKMLPELYQDYAKRKPLMISETASVEQGGDKAAWIASARNLMENRFPSISAFIYYNDEDRSEPVNWCVDSSSGAMAAFRAMGRDPYFRQRD